MNEQNIPSLRCAVLLATLTLALAVIPAMAQNAVPATSVRQAAASSGLAPRSTYSAQAQATSKSRPFVPSHKGLASPQDSGSYNNGPTNGTNDAYFIDVYQVSDQYPTSSGMGGFSIAEWVLTGATPLTFDWEVGSTSFGNDLGSGVATIGGGGNATATLLCSNGQTFNGGPCGSGYGYDVYQINVTGLTVAAGTNPYLTLTGATDNFGDRDAWDINSGPSLAYHNLLGAVPSESFTISGGVERVVHAFNPSTRGDSPYASLISDAAGNLYGTTSSGGSYGGGTVYELTPNGSGGWTEKRLFSFDNGIDGAQPYAGLIFDAAGNLYGTTVYGGLHGYGIVFELMPNGSGGWAEKVLKNFWGVTGENPYSSLIFDAAGNLYGTTYAGGLYGYGTVFELMPNGSGGWTETVLHSFGSGAQPYAGLIFDAAGNLYGTTSSDGTYNGGTAYELTPNGSGGWTEKVLHNFNGTDGAGPLASLIFDAAGNLYGTTAGGGTHRGGTVFELTPNGSGGWTEKRLFNFDNGIDGSGPWASLIFDAAGNLYGTTSGGGIHGWGIVFELMPNGSGGWGEKVLRNFGNGYNGVEPYASLIFDAAGNLYGTTRQGGMYEAGTVFELTPTHGGQWTEKELYNFSLNGSDGFYPYAGLISDAAGNLYGTTSTGGAASYGTVFELTPNGSGGWTEKVLHNFSLYTDPAGGYTPYAGLILDRAGNLYGTTTAGGTYGYGTVFELTPNGSGGWTETVLHNFGSGTDGSQPLTSLIFDSAGNLYGTTFSGGTYGNNGTVFELTPQGGGGWTETVLYNFGDGTDARNPVASLIFDSAGDLYGTTSGGGIYARGVPYEQGTVFELTPTHGGQWTETVLHSFGNGTDGADPEAGLIFDGAGNLYGTTYWGGTYSNGGTVFELTPNGSGGWTETVLHNLGSGTDGAAPEAGLIFDAAGNLYGTTVGGGTYQWGTVFEITP